MSRCKILGLKDRILLRLFGRKIRRDARKFYELTKDWEVQDYINYSEQQLNKILEFPWNNHWKKRIGIFKYQKLKDLGVTKIWPEIKPKGAKAKTVSTGTIQSKTIYYTKYDAYHLWLINIKYAYKLKTLPFRTSLSVTSGYTHDCTPFTTTLFGAVGGYIYGAKNLHLTYDELDRDIVEKFVRKYGPFDRIFVFLTYLYKFVRIMKIKNMIHNQTIFSTSGDVFTYNVFSAIKKFYTYHGIDEFRVVNIYGTSEVGLAGIAFEEMSDWNPKIQYLESVLDNVLPTFRHVNLKTGEVDNELLLIDEVKVGEEYIIYMTPLKSVFVPNYDVGDIVRIESKTKSAIIYRVLGRYGRPIQIDWQGEKIKALEQSAIKLSGVSISSIETINVCGKIAGGPCIMIVDSREKKIWIYTEKKLDLLKFTKACRENPNTISLLIALEQGWELENIHGNEALKFMKYFFELEKKRTGILYIPENHLD